MPWCLNHMKIASLTGCDFFFCPVSISFLCCTNSCNTSQAWSAAELIYSFNIAVSQQDIAKSQLGKEREKKYHHSFTFLSLAADLHIILKVGSFQSNHRPWPWFSFPVIQSPLPSFLVWAQQLYGTADLTEIWCFKSGFSKLLALIIYHIYSSLTEIHMGFKCCKTPDNETISPTTSGQL